MQRRRQASATAAPEMEPWMDGRTDGCIVHRFFLRQPAKLVPAAYETLVPAGPSSSLGPPLPTLIPYRPLARGPSSADCPAKGTGERSRLAEGGGGARRPSRTEGAAGGRLRCHRTTPRGLTRSNPGFVVVGAMRKDASDTTSGPRDRITRSGDSASPRPWAPPSVRTGRGVAHLAVGCHVGGSDGSASSPRRMRRLSAGGSPPTVVGPAYQVRGHVPISGDASSRGRSHRAPGTKPFRVVPQLGTSSPTD
ncbi:hypothetical protein BHM03_00015820 [Ensete ventricosum]|nr:hypothetical protein BHM03_00015820 [Ensete ventricosum]